MTISKQDLKYTLRQLRRSPAFSIIAVLTLALGIGATTAMFTIVQNVLLKPLRYPEPQQLVAIRESISTPKADFNDMPANANHLEFWRAHNHSFTEIAALLPVSLPIGGGGQTEEIGVARETGNLHTLLGVPPQLGRTFTAEEEKPGHEVVILTDGLWRRRYNADPAILGKPIQLDGKQYVVVGVLPPNFTLPGSRAIGGVSGTSRPIEAFIPFGWTAEWLDANEGDHDFFALGRLKPGTTVAQATADLNALQKDISRQTQDKISLSIKVIPFQDYLTGSSRRALLVLLVAVCAILLIACINITNLLLTRAAGRSHEAAVRLALGATRAQLIKSALLEPLLLSLAGCLLGTALAFAALPLLLRDVPAELPGIANVHIDLPILAFSLGISFLAALACGLFPAWRFSRATPQPALRSETRTSSESHNSKRLRQALVVGEVTASVLLVVMAGLFITSLLRLLHVDRGFQSEHVLSAEIALPDKQYGEDAPRNAFYDQALERLRQLPGVQSAGVVSVLPLDGDSWGDMIRRKGDPRSPWELPIGHWRWMSPGYLETLRVPLVAGRLLTPADRDKDVAIISHRLAEAVWPGQNPIGQTFGRMDPSFPPITVIGVVSDIRSLDLAAPAPNMVYMSYWFRSRKVGSFVIRTSSDPTALASSVRKAIWSIDSQVAIPNIRTMDTVVDASVSARRFQMHLLLLFAAISLLLSGLGIYGVVAYSTAQRTQEIGIRMALGAGYSDVYRLILSEGIAPVLIGAACGIGLAILSGHVMANLLFEVKPGDPVTTIAACAILVATGICACLLPAWRATKINPVQALRCE